MLGTLPERFWAKVDKHGPLECWLWLGSQASGYGQIRLATGTRTGAHRVAYFLANGDINPDLEVLHSCDNSRCVNAAHLGQGTHAENQAEKSERGRTYRPPHGPRPILTDKTARAILDERAQGALRKTLAAKFGVSIHTINSLLYGRNWVHVSSGAQR